MASCKNSLSLADGPCMGRHLILSETLLEIQQKQGEDFVRHSKWISRVVTPQAVQTAPDASEPNWWPPPK